MWSKYLPFVRLGYLQPRATNKDGQYDLCAWEKMKEWTTPKVSHWGFGFEHHFVFEMATRERKGRDWGRLGLRRQMGWVRTRSPPLSVRAKTASRTVSDPFSVLDPFRTRSEPIRLSRTGPEPFRSDSPLAQTTNEGTHVKCLP